MIPPKTPKDLRLVILEPSDSANVEPQEIQEPPEEPFDEKHWKNHITTLIDSYDSKRPMKRDAIINRIALKQAILSTMSLVVEKGYDPTQGVIKHFFEDVWDTNYARWREDTNIRFKDLLEEFSALSNQPTRRPPLKLEP